MIRYRVYTENVSYDDTLALARKLLPDSFTVFHAQGHYQGQDEKSLVFEIVDGEHRDAITRFAYHVKKQNNQQCVLITEEPVEVHVI